MALSSTFAVEPVDASEKGQAWRQVATFYALATALSLAIWIPFGAQIAGLLPGHVPASLVVASQYSPTIAALMLIAAEGGWAGVVNFLKRSLNPRIGFRWYAVALFTPPLMGIGLIAIHALTGPSVPALADLRDFPGHVAQFFRNVHDNSGGAAAASPVIQSLARWALQGAFQAALALFAIAFANGGISEEAGWRGYALARLLPGRSALTAALVVGFFWGLWHTGPAFWAAMFQANWRAISNPLEYTLGTVPLTVMIAWVFINAKKSLLPGMVFHACYNATFFFLTQIWTPEQPVVSVLEWLAASYVAALIVIVIGRKTLLARR